MRALALLLTLPTGFAGLVYEVAWQRWLATLLGAHSEATAAVLALFLGGLSLGYAGFGAWTRRLSGRGRGSLLVAYGGIEAAIGLWAFLFPSLFGAAQALSFRLPFAGPGLQFACDVALSALLVVPPATLMGATIPVLTQALARGLDDSTRIHARVYALNTGGACAGALAAAFWLIPDHGLDGALRVVGGVNLAAGGAYALLGLRLGRASAAPLSAAEPGFDLPDLRAYLAIAFLAGFAMMTIQTVLNRVGAFSFGSSQFTFAMIVAVFVLCIALGSFAVSALSRVPDALLLGCLWALPLALFFLYRPLENAPYWAHVLRSFFRDEPQAFLPYHVAILLGLLAVLGAPIALSGALLPLLFHHLRRRAGELGRTAGRIYAWNTLGSLAGALVGGYLLFFFLDLHQVYRVALAGLLLAAILQTALLAPGAWRAAALGLVIPVGVALALLPAWAGERLAVGAYRQRSPLPTSYAGPDAFYAARRDIARLVRYEDDPVASIAVVEMRGALALLTNGKNDSSLGGDQPTTVLLGLLPALFARAPERSLVVGYGTGVTVGALAALPATREVVVAEISRGVIHSAPLFDHANHAASRHPKVRIVEGDALRTLMRSSGDFDVIASEPSNPWVVGVENVYSLDFLQAARARLRPGGVFAQWVQLYDMDDETLALVLRTFARAFDHVSVWYGVGVDLLVLGFDDAAGALDVARLEARAAEPEFAAGLAAAGVTSFAELLAHELLPLDVVRADPAGPVHTLGHPLLADRAARSFFRGVQASLPRTAAHEPAAIGARHSLVLRWAALRGGALAPDATSALAAETCEQRPQECLAWLAREQPVGPSVEELEARLSALAYGQGAVGPELLFWLVRPLPADASAVPVSPGVARELTSLFERYYHHAAPFSRGALAAIWRDCARDPARAAACQNGVAAAERRRGPLRDERPAPLPAPFSTPGAQ
jgi:spermidine synthase